MTDPAPDDLAWLRARPEIVAAYDHAYAVAKETTTQGARHAAVAAILPALRVLIRADVVRELAGDVNAIEDRVFRFVSQNELVLPNPQLAFDKVLSLLIRERAAAHAAGRAAGIEEAANKIAESVRRAKGMPEHGPTYADGTFQDARFVYIEAALAAIRGLP